MVKIVDLFPISFTGFDLRCIFNYKDAKTGLLKSDKIKIPMGADGVSWETFEKQLNTHAKNIFSRVLNGNYFFYPFRG